MFRVLIVDDEPIIRKGLRNVVDWKSIGCEVCGEAGDGVEGMEMIKVLKPHIVITDIKMPGYDGLKMIREASDIIPGGRIIILTGFRDFEYLQEAIKLGAFDYLLKPARIEDVTSVIRKAVSEIESCLQKEEELKNLKIEFEKRVPLLKQKFLYDIMFRILFKKEEILEYEKMYGLNINDYLLMIVEIDENDEDNGRSRYENQLYQFGIINAFEECFQDEFTIYNTPLNSSKVVFIVQPWDMKGEFLETAHKNINNLKSIISCCFGPTITVSISTLGLGILSLPEKLEEAEEGLRYKLYIGKNSIILYEDVRHFYRLSDFSILENYQKSLIQSVRVGNEKNVRSSLKDIQSRINEQALDIESVKKYYLNLLNSIDSTQMSDKATTDIGALEKRWSDVYCNFESCSTIDELSSTIEKVCIDTASQINNFNHKTINSTLHRAIDYINSHYCDSVTLNDVADYAFVSTYYLSRMFTKELGKNFVDYLNEVRIEKAREFLRTTSYKTYEIAEMVGIRDAHYFSKIFKKYTGLTPSECRDKPL